MDASHSHTILGSVVLQSPNFKQNCEEEAVQYSLPAQSVTRIRVITSRVEWLIQRLLNDK